MAKGIGIMLVVMGHCQATMFQQVIIGSFHMPLFFFLSGLFLFQREETFGFFLKKKAKTLLFPCVVFGLILSTYSTIIDIVTHNDTIPLGLRYVGLLINMRQNPYPGSLWFFPCLFLVEMFLYGLNSLSKSIHCLISGSVVLALIGILVHHYYGKGLPWSLDIALYSTIFTAVGYSVKKLIKEKYSSYLYIIAGLLFCVSTYTNYKYSGVCVDLYSCRLGSYLLFFCSAFLGIFLILGLSKLLKNNQIFKFYGANSLILYSIQFIFIRPVTKLVSLLIPYGLAVNLLSTVIVMIISIPIINIINIHFKWMTGKF